jgi:hypothetical protein
MRYVKFIVLGIGLLSALLSAVYGAFDLGGAGITVFVACLIPAALCAFGTFVKPTIPRWAAIVSVIAFLVVGMKTSGGGSDFENVMLLAFLGLILSIVLSIRPDRPREPAAVPIPS